MQRGLMYHHLCLEIEMSLQSNGKLGQCGDRKFTYWFPSLHKWSMLLLLENLADFTAFSLCFMTLSVQMQRNTLLLQQSIFIEYY